MATVPSVTAGANRAGANPVPPFPVQSAIPVLAFLAVNRLFGLRWAVAITTILSVLLVADRRRKGVPLGKVMPILTIAILARGAIGIVTDSESVYFGLGIAAKYAVGAVLVASVALGRPLANRALPFLDISQEERNHAEMLKTGRDVTLIGGLYYLVSASVDVWLFQRSSVEGFVLLRFLASWPLTAAALAAVGMIATTRCNRIPGLAPLTEVIEQSLAKFAPTPNSASSGQNKP